VESAFKSALGIKLEELSDEWQRQMRKEYWPDIANRQEPGDMARAITNHKKTKNVWIVLENKVIKQLIRGESSINFEELHWLSPGMGWSPDGKKVTFTAKAGDQDALYIYDIASGDIEQHKFDLDGLFSATWSPAGNEIAFVGNMNGASDIFIFDLESDKINNITNDVFSDSYPEWSSDGEQLVFVSERGDYIYGNELPSEFKMADHNYENTDIYLIDKDGSHIQRLTNTPSRESDPVLSADGKYLLYSGDESGVYNIYKKELETDNVYAVTNLLTGAFQLSLDKHDKTLAFASFSEGGWDIFTIKDPFSLTEMKPDSTVYLKNMKKTEHKTTTSELTIAEEDTTTEVVKMTGVGNYRNYVFADLDRRTEKKKVEVILKKDTYKLEDGHYKVRNYKVQFSPDLVNGAAGYNTLWGFQGYTSLAFSDVLGNHKINVGTNLVFDLKNSHLVLQYLYLPKRIDYGFSAFHYANTYYTTLGFVRYRQYGFWGLASRPFNKYTRLDFTLNWWAASMEFLQANWEPERKVQSVIPGLQIVHDTSEWRWPDTGPRDGFRGSIGLSFSPKYSRNTPEFVTLKTDLRKYFKITDNYSFGIRASAGASRGKNPQHFFLGGVSYWLNRDFKDGVRLEDLNDIYFSEFITPLRGARYYEKVGDNFALMNLEFRFPMIPYMQLGFPPIQLGNIKGLFFIDAGTAFYSSEWNEFRGIKNGQLQDIEASYGIGTRIFLLGLLVKYDVAWRYDLKHRSSPQHLVSLGIDF